MREPGLVDRIRVDMDVGYLFSNDRMLDDRLGLDQSLGGGAGFCLDDLSAGWVCLNAVAYCGCEALLAHRGYGGEGRGEGEKVILAEFVGVSVVVCALRYARVFGR